MILVQIVRKTDKSAHLSAGRHFFHYNWHGLGLLLVFGFRFYYINVSSTNYFTLYQRSRRTDVTISSKSLIIFVSPLINSPLRRGELTPDFVLYRGYSLKFIPFISSNPHYINANIMHTCYSAKKNSRTESVQSPRACAKQDKIKKSAG